MFKSGSKKSEQEIDLHQEVRLDKNQVNSGQLVTYIHLRVINAFCSVPDGPLTRSPGHNVRHGEMKDLVSKNDQNKTQLLNDNKRQCMTL